MKIFPDKKIKDHFDAFVFLRLDVFFEFWMRIKEENILL